MKVLIVHNRYQHRGGEDTVVEAELELLRANGVVADLHTVENDAISDTLGKLKVLWNMKDDPRSVEPVIARARAFGADVVHAHNFFPLLTPGLHLRLHAAGIPVVQTLHNYRLLCANGMFLRNDRVCEDCLTGGRINAVRYRCYRGSLPGTLALLRMQDAAIRNPEWQAAIGRAIALTQFQKDKLVAAGFRADRITVKGNSVADPGLPHADVTREGFLFVGRLAAGKGLDTLIEAWKSLPHLPLTIAGDGPELERLQNIAGPGITFLGRVDRDRVFALMKAAQFLLLPSIWYEGFPMTLVEAYACGLPVIASRIGGVPEIVPQGETGLLFEPGNVDALRSAVLRAAAPEHDARGMGLAARRLYEERHSPQANFEALQEIYHGVIR